MSLLVLGGAGQVGKALATEAARQGIACEAPYRNGVDICDPEAVTQAIARMPAGVIVNCAAYTDVDKAEREAERAFMVNKDGARNLAIAAAAAGMPLIHLSTDYVFDGAKTTPYDEDDPANPISVYGKSKLAGEECVRSHTAVYITLRTSWVFSAHGRNFVITLRRLADEGRKKFQVVADQHGAPTAAFDIAKCILQIVSVIRKPDFVAWGTYHFCGTPATTWYDFAKAVLADRPECLIDPISTTEWPTPARRPLHAVLNCARLEQTFGIKQPGWRKSLLAVLAETG